MKRTHEVLGGYRVPNGASGAAVRRACELIISNPGIRQSELLEQVVQFSSLNMSTAGWITSPSDKSPAGILWSRKKDGRYFCCYPNDLTPQCTGSVKALMGVWRKMPINCDWDFASTLSIGDVVIRKSDGAFFVFHGWTHRYTGETFKDIDSAMEHITSREIIAGEKTGWGVPPYPLWSSEGVFHGWGELTARRNAKFGDCPFVKS